MMLEQSLISPNFLGKESFRWFIGLCTQYKFFNGDGYKAKVRIIGYHPDAANIISDDELPWAHVLVPLNMGSGEGGTGVSFNSRGGETVIGFFMDGDNGQQPVIIGSLFSGYKIDHPNEFNDGTNLFNSFKVEKDSIKNPNNKSAETGRTFNQGGSDIPNSGNADPADPTKPTQGAVATDTGRDKKDVTNTQVVSIPPVCRSSKTTYSRIVKALRSFIKTLRTIQQVETGFINPVLNTIQDIPGLVQNVATAISDLFSEYMKQTRDNVIADIYKWLEDTINKLLPKDIKLFKQIATDKIVDSIWCAFSKIIKGIGEFVFNFLTQLVGAVTNIPICAAEAFAGSVISTLTNEVSDAIAPALEEFSSELAGGIGEVSSYVFQALTYANQALSFLSCESSECKEVLDYEMNKGYIPQETIDDVQRVLNYPNTGIEEGKEAAEKWLGITGGENSDSPYSYLSATYGYCDAINLDCGLPTIEFFGGGGSGATGSAVVDALGQMIGITIQNSGTGYSSPPYISIEDPCGNGSGAVASANTTDGQVTSVTIEKPGSGYLGPISTTTPCTTNPIDETGSDVIGYIVGVNIINTGVGYNSNNLITDIACISDVEIYPIVDNDGRIIGTNIINSGSAIRIYPQLSINTEDGEGAILQPILNFKPVESVSTETNVSKIKKVVLCAEDHGR
jgi:hypothetical protein